MAVSAGPNLVEDGLVFCLDAANSKSYPGSGTTWTDLSGNGNNGTLVNSPTYSSDNLGNFSIPGGAKIDVDATNLKTDSGTWSIWLKSSDTTNNYIEFMSLATPDSYASNGMTIYIGLNNCVFGMKNGTTQIALHTLTNNFSDNNWHNVVVTYQKNVNCSGYFDGQQVVSSSLSTWNWTSSNILRICGRTATWSDADNFTGNVSSVSVYNRVLTEQEVSQNFNALRGRYGI